MTTRLAPTVRSAETQARFSRRALLQRLGVGAGVLPLLEAERVRAAAPNGFPKRLITIAWTNGVAQPSFYPPGDDPIASDILKVFEPVKGKVLLPLGIDLKIMLDGNHRYDGHFSYPTLFTGTYRNLGGQNATATGPSIDQVVSDAIAKQVNLPVPIMNVAASGSPTSFRADAQRNTAETDPRRMHARLFAGGNLSAGQIDALRLRRKSVLDYLGKDLDAYGKRVGTEDRAKIGAHIQSIRQLETALAATATKGTCAAPVAPTASGDYPTKVKLFNEMAAIGIRCDATRVVSMVWGADGGSGPSSFPFIGVAEDYHGLAHKGAAGYADKIRIDTWLFQQVADLAKALDQTAEAGSTALDNTVIVTANDMNEGAGHDISKLPWVIVGSGGGYLKTGKAVRLGSWVGKSGAYWRGDAGVAHNKLLATIANALDVPGDSFGAPAYAGTLPELRK
jgi:hypothetical protein